MTNPTPIRAVRYLPREHGATAMLITPIVCAALLARTWRWAELAVLVGAFAALAAKDPLVVVLRSRFLWKTPHAETPVAARWLAGWTALLAASGTVIALTWPRPALVIFAVGIGGFGALTAWVNYRNRQRSVVFQIASAVALTSTGPATCLTALGRATPEVRALWLLLALQAATGILVVHARLDAKIAMKRGASAPVEFRRAAFAAVGVLAAAAVAAGWLGRLPVAAGLGLAAVFYLYDLRRQREWEFLDMPLKRVGLRALAVSSVYALLMVAGVW